MNVFVLDRGPVLAARALCDRHVVKMCLEYGQVLAGARRLNRLPSPIRPTHLHHPVVKWAAGSTEAYCWTWKAWVEVLREYEARYGKRHAWMPYPCYMDPRPTGAYQRPPADFCQCLPDDLKGSDPVEAYRSYYLRDKAYFAKWAKGTPAPDWWVAANLHT